jgi:hypothetical protein
VSNSAIRFSTFPRTKPPPAFVNDVVAVFRQHEGEIATEINDKGLKSDDVLAVLGPDLAALGFQDQRVFGGSIEPNAFDSAAKPNSVRSSA